MKKIAIIGASYLQAPLIQRAKEMGLETHVFAWAANDVGETMADFFYPISIVEKEAILRKCQEIHIDGICSIASDLAMRTVNFVAHEMKLIGNTPESTAVSTNKHLMRERFKLRGDPSPVSYMIGDASEVENMEFHYPLIVKPLDRSGSRGITKVIHQDDLKAAIEKAQSEGFDKHVLIEEYVDGIEYSVEYISWRGEHRFLALTQKYTTGAPGFIETGHIQPAVVSKETLNKIKGIVSHALSSLEIEYGASHSEIKIDNYGDIRIIEIGARMGGDLIGSHLVQLATGYDFLKGVIDIALGKAPDEIYGLHHKAAAVRFVLNSDDYKELNALRASGRLNIILSDIKDKSGSIVTDSSKRWGYLLAVFDNRAEADEFMNT